MYVKKGDKVQVISGKDKGKQGVILQAYPKTGRVIVEGVHVVTKHAKPSQVNPQGGILEMEATIHASNVMLLDPDTNEPTRIGYQVTDGKKVRVAKKSGKVIDK